MVKLKMHIILLLFILSCKNSPVIVPKPEDMSEGEYIYIHKKLESAKSKGNYFEIGVQLANLEAPAEEVFKNLNKGIRQDSSNCDRIITWEMIRREGGFYNNVVIVDTTEFYNSLQLCKSIIDSNRYDSLLNIADRRKKHIETSTELRRSLIDTLEKLFISDQKDRKLLSGPNRKTLEKDKAFRAKIEYADSINLIVALKIIDDYNGYPDTKFVGKEYNNVLWSIFQHVSDLDLRIKYRPILTDAIDRQILGHGALEAYDKRTQQIKWKNE